MGATTDLSGMLCVALIERSPTFGPSVREALEASTLRHHPLVSTSAHEMLSALDETYRSCGGRWLVLFEPGASEVPTAEFVHRMRAHAHLQGFPVLVMASAQEMVLANDLMRVAVGGVFLKPDEQQALNAMVQLILTYWSHARL